MQVCRLAAIDLACRRGDRVLFEGLGFDLAPGGALKIGGANGIGKSSLIRMLAGLLRPLAGSIERDGAIGLLDERPALDEHLPLGKALGFWAAMDGNGLDATRRLGLENLLDVPVRFLSTGQRKRAALARLIGQQAPVWLLDEPLNGLDSAAIGLVEELVAEHRAVGGIALVASHQPIRLDGGDEIALAEFAR